MQQVRKCTHNVTILASAHEGVARVWQAVQPPQVEEFKEQQKWRQNKYFEQKFDFLLPTF
jgi:hypothetical protein